MCPVGSLILNRRVPPGIIYYDSVCRCQVQPGSTCFQAQEKNGDASVSVEIDYPLHSILGLSIEIFIFYRFRVEPFPYYLEQACELTEEKYPVATVETLKQKLLEKFRLCGTDAGRPEIGGEKIRMTAELSEPEKPAQHIDPVCGM